MALEPLWSLNRRLEQRRGLSRAGAPVGGGEAMLRRDSSDGTGGTRGGWTALIRHWQQGCGSVGGDGMGRLAMNEKRKKKWGGFKSTAMEMKHRRLINDSLEDQQELGNLSSLPHTCWCSSGPIYYRPCLRPTTTSEIFMLASSVFYVLSARFQNFRRRRDAASGHTQAAKDVDSSKIFLSLSPGSVNSQKISLFCSLFPFRMTTLCAEPESHCLREE